MLNIKPLARCEAGSSFPAINGLLKLKGAYYGFQLTARNSHDVKVDELSKIISCLADCRELLFVWAHDLSAPKCAAGPCKGESRDAFELWNKVVTMWHHQLITEPGGGKVKTFHIEPLEKRMPAPSDSTLSNAKAINK